MHALSTILKFPAVRRLGLAIYLVLIITTLSLYINIKFKKDSVMKIRVDEYKELNYEESARLARRFDSIVDKIDKTNWSPLSDDDYLSDWTFEITPMFMHEGLVGETVYDFDFFFYPQFDGSDHNYIAGRSDCATYVFLNARYQNKISNWLQRPNWPVVLAHEIAHMQQGKGCDRLYNSPDSIENTAQIMAWEVMAALANQGSPDAIFSLSHELRGSAISAAAAMAATENVLDDYDKLLEDVYGSEAGKKSSIAKGRRFWADNLDELNELRMRYSWMPLNMVFEGRYEGTIYQLAMSNPTRSAEIDDLLYFIEHMEELVDWAIEYEYTD